tara:strand:- start:3052 stop:4689 length:1638 start_codon:yes stop_codon:yes gene_type:complete
MRELGTLRRSDVVEWAGTMMHIVGERYGQSPEVQRELIDLCLDSSIANSASDILMRDGRNVLFYRRQLWLLLQFACVVCGNSGAPLTSLKGSFGRLCLIASDCLRSIHLANVSTSVDEKERLEWQMALLISTAEIMPDSSFLARAHSLWFDSVSAPTVAKELENSGVQDGLDHVFRSHVGISLTDTFFTLMTVYKYLTARTKTRPVSPIVMTLDGEWWGAVPYDDRLRVFGLLSVPVDKFSAHLFGTPRQSWATDFSSVMARPFIESQPGCYICPDIGNLRTFFLDGIFWLFHEALQGKEWGNAFGAMYEWYMKQLLSAATGRRTETQDMYHDNVKFQGTKEEVCDSLLISASTAVLFEAKGTRLSTRQKSGVSVHETSDAVTKSVGSNKSGIGQLARNIARILRGDAVVAGDIVLDIAARTDIIPVLVWYEEAASNAPTQQFLDNAFVERLIAEGVDPSRVGPLLLFSTSELELFEQFSHYVSPDVLLEQFADFVLRNPGDPRCTFLRYAVDTFERKTVDHGFVGAKADRLFESARAEHVRRTQ